MPSPASSLSRLPDPFNPLEEPDRFLSWLERYLIPRPLGGGGHRAHQFTINGLTYPFVRYYNFAGVPDVPEVRQYDMYAGLHIPQDEDLLFFFQADPQAHSGDINSRRGIRGIYRVRGRPYRATAPARDEVSGVGYLLLDRCPNCQTPLSTLSSTCWN